MRPIFSALPFALLLGVLSACAEKLPPAPPQNTAHWAVPVKQEANLYRVDRHLFRSEQLLPEDYPLLKQQGIKTVINLRFFDRNDDKKYFAGTGLNLINTPLMSWSVSPKDLAGVLWQIRQAQAQGAVLVHCYHGAGRTGLVSAMYRIVYQGWNPAEARREMMEGPYGFHPVWRNMAQFFTEQNIREVKARLDALAAEAEK